MARIEFDLRRVVETYDKKRPTREEMANVRVVGDWKLVRELSDKLQYGGNWTVG